MPEKSTIYCFNLNSDMQYVVLSTTQKLQVLFTYWLTVTSITFWDEGP